MEEEEAPNTARGSLLTHAFEFECTRHDIDHRLTKTNHPWTNRQVECMNRIIKEAAVKAYIINSLDPICATPSSFFDDCSFAKHLKSLVGLSPFQFICSCFQK